MFTGLVQSVGTVREAAQTKEGLRLAIEPKPWRDDPDRRVRHGDSICVSGVCLTLAGDPENGLLRFDVVAETLRRSTLGSLGVGSRVNLEPSLRAGDAMGGHFVQGHVDAVVEVTQVRDDPGDWRVRCAMPAGQEALFASKGSVTVEGVSLTLAEVDRASFAVALIPTTLEETTLGALEAGSRVNVETDVLARTVVSALARAGRLGGGNPTPPEERMHV